MTTEIVVTGLGVVHAAGVGAGPLRDVLAAGRSPTSPVEPFAGLRSRRASRAALVGPLPPHEQLPMLVARRMSRLSRFAVLAAYDGLADAGLDAGAEPDPDRAVVVATAFGPSSFTQRLLDQMLDGGPQAASPSLFPECVASAPAAQIGICCKAAGAALTLCSGEAGSIAAVGRACDVVRSGRATHVLAGSVEEMTPLLHAVLDRFGALARGDPRPLAARRDGCLAAEGAAVTVIERAEDARRRGARVRARVVAWGSAHDATAGPARWGSRPDVLGRALARSLARADLHPGSIDRIVCGASGSVAGDRVEAALVREAWRRAPLPRVLAPKGATGEYGGGFLAAAVLAARDLDVGPCPGCDEPDDGLGVAPWRGGRLDTPQRVLVTAAAAGGSAAWLVLEAP